jgi:SAM-dependent MidA family methyltransferase
MTAPLAHIIREEIAEQGPIPFNRFMELALYCPEYGFYEKEGDNVGRAGDFYTSVSVGSLFGELLGFQFARWLGALPGMDCGLRIIEAGAHDGRLAGDILRWLHDQRPGLFARTEYCLLEPSSRRREWQRRMLADFNEQIRWFDDFPHPQTGNRDPQFTVILANELLDAMPVRRFGWDANRKRWFEWGVNTEGDRFVWSRLALLPATGEGGGGFAELPDAPELLAILPDGFTVELNLAAEQWWAKAAQALAWGKLVTFDYGFIAEEVLSPERSSGTLRAYRQHQQMSDVLADPGLQDITAHVHFPRIEQAGLAAGLKTERLESQARFLTHIAAEAWRPEAHFGEWDARRTRQFQTLTHPQHLGHNFHVLVQSRG